MADAPEDGMRRKILQCYQAQAFLFIGIPVFSEAKNRLFPSRNVSDMISPRRTAPSARTMAEGISEHARSSNPSVMQKRVEVYVDNCDHINQSNRPAFAKRRTSLDHGCSLGFLFGILHLTMFFLFVIPLVNFTCIIS